MHRLKGRLVLRAECGQGRFPCGRVSIQGQVSNNHAEVRLRSQETGQHVLLKAASGTLIVYKLDQKGLALVLGAKQAASVNEPFPRRTYLARVQRKRVRRS